MAPTTQTEPAISEVVETGGTKKIDPHANARAVFNTRGQQIAQALDQYDVPDEKVTPVVEYAIKLLSGNPHIKNQRIVRKTAERFHLKLKDHAAS